MSQLLPVVHQGTCTCGAVTVKTYTSPILVFNCHCTHCQAFINDKDRPYNDSSMFWKWAVTVDCNNEQHLTYLHTTAQYGLIGLHRGKCSKCNDPVIEYGRGMLYPFVCPNAKVLKLQPTCNIMYNSGKQFGTMGLKTYYSDFMTNVMIYPILIFVAVPQLVYDIVWKMWLLRMKKGRRH